jgi:hypothetical protein
LMLAQMVTDDTLSYRKMRDADGPTIAELFYSKLFENESISNDDIARALDYAVRGLRDRSAAGGLGDVHACWSIGGRHRHVLHYCIRHVGIISCSFTHGHKDA